ncbi:MULTISPECIES: hypothetical protein [unclassified Mycobacterium]|uniref:hypothetical protein n=1 Tax=unclassified Mycobacterium TaxID=2642494 RepID=UPI0029C60DDD|nr:MULTISPECIES: hypothetical protein [unclassified Mycobacterium]
MTPCNALKCLTAANETMEPLPLVGPLCDDHRARALAGEDFELQGSEPSVTGTAQPTVLMGDALLSLDQYVLLEPPTELVSGKSPGQLVPLRVRRRGEPTDREVNLVIPDDMMPAVVAFFDELRRFFGRPADSK